MSITRKCSALQEILGKESELVEKIAEVLIQFRNSVLLIYEGSYIHFIIGKNPFSHLLRSLVSLKHYLE